MTKSNDQTDSDFPENYDPSDYIKEQASEGSKNTIERESSISFDGEQYFVRFPKEISQLKDLDKHKVKFTGIEKPPEDGSNEIIIELVEE